MSASAKMVSSASGCAMTKISFASMTAPVGKVFQYSYEPGVEGAFDTFGNAYCDRSTLASVGL